MRVVCALSGGGAKSAAHLGAVKALEERGLTPAHYVATSTGAIVAACLASGLSYEQTLLRMTRLKHSDVAAPSGGAVLGYYSHSFLRGKPLRETIARLVPARRFDELAVPLTVTAVDIENGQLVLFGGRTRVPCVLTAASLEFGFLQGMCFDVVPVILDTQARTIRYGNTSICGQVNGLIGIAAKIDRRGHVWHLGTDQRHFIHHGVADGRHAGTVRRPDSMKL